MMKKQFFLFAILCSISAMQAQQFVKVGGSATDIAINPKNGKVFVVSNKNVFTDYNTSSKRWRTYSSRPNNASSIAITKDGVVYMVSTAKDVFIEVKGKWIKVPGIKTNEVITTRFGKIFAIDTSKKLRQLFGGQWKLLIGQNRNSNGLNQIVGTSSKGLHGLDGSNRFREFAGTWKTLNGQPNKITLDQKTNRIYAVGRNKGIYSWDSRAKKWNLLKGTRKDFVDVAVHNGEIWAISANKAIYKYDPRKRITSIKDYSGTYKVTITRRLRSDTPLVPEFYGVAGVRLQNRKGGRLVTINPKNNMPARFLDIPQNDMAKVRKLSRPIKSNTLLGTVAYNDYEWYYTINQVREFDLSKADADENAEFKFELNLKESVINLGHTGGWYSYVLPLKNIKFGREYATGKSGICFKVEKIR